MSEYDEAVEKRDQARAEYEADPTNENYRRMMALSAEARYRRGPSVEQMIEEMLYWRNDGWRLEVEREANRFTACLVKRSYGDTEDAVNGDESESIEAAIAALYRTWRERE